MTALVLALLLIAYPNGLAWLSARRRWDQWHAFMIGNAALAVVLLAYAGAAGLLPAVWGHVTPHGLLRAAIAGLIPLALILLLMFLPGQLGRDIVASGIGAISPRRFLYRVSVQVAVTTVVCEEFAFRGLLQVLLSRAAGAAWAVVALDAAVFSLWHVTLQYNGFASQSGLARWGATVGGSGIYLLLGLLLALVRLETGGLFAPIITHGILDVFMFAGMYVRKFLVLSY